MDILEDSDWEFRLPSGLGDLLRVLGASRRSEVEDLRARLLAEHLAAARRGRVASVVAQVELGEVAGEVLERGAIVLGLRGSGKTTGAASIALECRRRSGRKVLAVGIPGEACEALGFRQVRLEDLVEGRESGWVERSILVVDEAGLGRAAARVGADHPLRAWLAVGRHREIAVVWVAQHGAQVARECFRYGSVLCCRRLDPVAVEFDREELREALGRVCDVQASLEARGEDLGRWAVWVVGGRYWVSRLERPAAWEDRWSHAWAERPWQDRGRP